MRGSGLYVDRRKRVGDGTGGLLRAAVPVDMAGDRSDLNPSATSRKGGLHAIGCRGAVGAASLTAT